MIKTYFPYILISICIILIILNFVFTAHDMNIAFWLRNLTNLLVITSMVLTIQKRKKVE